MGIIVWQREIKHIPNFVLHHLWIIPLKEFFRGFWFKKNCRNSGLCCKSPIMIVLVTITLSKIQSCFLKNLMVVPNKEAWMRDTNLQLSHFYMPWHQWLSSAFFQVLDNVSETFEILINVRNIQPWWLSGLRLNSRREYHHLDPRFKSHSK